MGTVDHHLTGESWQVIVNIRSRITGTLITLRGLNVVASQGNSVSWEPATSTYRTDKRRNSRSLSASAASKVAQTVPFPL